MNAKYVWCILRLIAAVGFIISLLFYPDDSSAQMKRRISKRHFIYGSVELNYQRWWHNDNPPAHEFGQHYNLGLRSFLKDPRLINFDISGILTKLSNNYSEESTLTGVNLNINLLETPQRQWKGARRYIPGPIRLRYSKYVNDYESTNYGIALIYSMPQSPAKRKSQEEKNGARKDLKIPFPTLYFDYDKYNYKSETYESSSDLYTLRATLSRPNSRYEFLYQNFNRTDYSNFKRTIIQFQPDYRFYNKETKRSINIDNSFEVEELDGTDRISLSSKLRWHKPYNRDSLSLLSSFDYSSLSTDKEKTDNYRISASEVYTKTFSPTVVNTTSLSLSYGKSNIEIRHSERLNNNITIELSRILKGSNRVSIENNESGSEFGIHTQLSSKTRISATAGYSFNSSSYKDNKTLSNAFTLFSTGRLKDNVSFNTGASYTIRDFYDTSTVHPYSEYIFSYSTNLFWRLPKTSLSLGGNYSHRIKDNGEPLTTNFISLNGNLSRNLMKQIFLNTYAIWTKDSTNKIFFEFKPKIFWNTRQISFDVEYNYRRTSFPEVPASTEHRIFAKAIRRFSKLL